jgi:hypothetical protein
LLYEEQFKTERFVFCLLCRPPGSPSKDSIFKRAKALYSFNAKNPKELTVFQGDELMVWILMYCFPRIS